MWYTSDFEVWNTLDVKLGDNENENEIKQIVNAFKPVVLLENQDKS